MTARQTQRSPFEIDAAREIVAGLRHLDGAMLPILHALQERFGYIDPAAIPIVAEALNVSRAEVHGVVTFYHDFRDAAGRPARPQGLPRRGLPVDGLRGARRAPGRRARHLHGRDDARWPADLEAVYCLGNCALSPAAMLDGELIGRVDRDVIDALVQETKGVLS